MFARRDVLRSTAALAAIAVAPMGAFAQSEEAKITVSDMALGDASAPVTMIEYASFTCPHCATFHSGVLMDLKRDYIDTGKLRLIHREVFFDRYGLWASMVARCGGEMRYFGIIDRIYATQAEWTAGGDPATIADNLRKIGLASGLGTEELDACLSDAETAQALVGWYQENAEADEINSTPTFLINGEKYTNMSYERFAEVIDGKIDE